MRDDAWRPQPLHDAIREVARPFRRASRKQDDITGRHRAVEYGAKSIDVVRHDSEWHGIAAKFADRRSEDGRVAVIDAADRQRHARRPEFAPRRDNADARPRHHRDALDAERREHAGFARCEQSPSKENGFAAADVGTRECHVRAGAAGRVTTRRLSRTSVNSIITTALAPRGSTPPVAMDTAHPDPTTTPGGMPAAMVVESIANITGLIFDRAECILGPHREAIDVGTIEPRHVQRRTNIGGENATRGKRRATRFPKREGSDRGGRGSGEGPHLGRVRSGTGVGGGRRSCPRSGRWNWVRPPQSDAAAVGYSHPELRGFRERVRSGFPR